MHLNEQFRQYNSHFKTISSIQTYIMSASKKNLKEGKLPFTGCVKTKAKSLGVQNHGDCIVT